MNLAPITLYSKIDRVGNFDDAMPIRHKFNQMFDNFYNLNLELLNLHADLESFLESLTYQDEDADNSQFIIGINQSTGLIEPIRESFNNAYIKNLTTSYNTAYWEARENYLKEGSLEKILRDLNQRVATLSRYKGDNISYEEGKLWLKSYYNANEGDYLSSVSLKDIFSYITTEDTSELEDKTGKVQLTYELLDDKSVLSAKLLYNSITSDYLADDIELFDSKKFYSTVDKDSNLIFKYSNEEVINESLLPKFSIFTALTNYDSSFGIYSHNLDSFNIQGDSFAAVTLKNTNVNSGNYKYSSSIHVNEVSYYNATSSVNVYTPYYTPYNWLQDYTYLDVDDSFVLTLKVKDYIKYADTQDKTNLDIANINNNTLAEVNLYDKLKVGRPGGLVPLDENTKIASQYLPSYVDDVIEGYLSVNGNFYKDAAQTIIITPESDKIYTDLTSNKIYRYSGTKYVEISASLALGITSGTAFPGDRGYNTEQLVMKTKSEEATLEWDTPIKIATVNNVAINVALPENPNTFTKEEKEKLANGNLVVHEVYNVIGTAGIVRMQHSGHIINVETYIENSNERCWVDYRIDNLDKDNLSLEWNTDNYLSFDRDNTLRIEVTIIQ